MKQEYRYLAIGSAAAILLAPVAHGATPVVCDKPLTGSWRVVRDITPAGTVVGITDLMEKRMLKAEAFFSSSEAKFDGNTCMIRKVTRTPWSAEDRKLFRDPVRDKYPVTVSFQCATEEGVGDFYIGQRCDELATDWDGAYFLLKPSKR